MTLLADLTIRASVIVLAGLGGTLLLRRRSAALRHAVLAGSMFAAALTAPLSLMLPSWNLFAPEHVSPNTQGTVEPLPPTISGSAGATQEPPPATGAQLLVAVWAAGVLVGMARLLGGIHHLRRMSHGAGPDGDDRWTRMTLEISTACRLRRRVVICLTDTPGLLGTFGLWPPRVLLPSQARLWSDERIRVVLLHEVAHIRRHDWIVQLCTDALRSVCWFNPLFRVACARLRRHSEQACDDAVLRAGIQPRAYAAHLLDLARVCRRHDLASAVTTPMARPSTLERRVFAMLDSTLDIHRCRPAHS